jgi:cytoskeletal protein CcmA (bactofilin family)
MIFRRLRIRRARTEPELRQSGTGPSIIAADVEIEGNIVTAGELHIDGNIHGDVQAQTVMIDTKGTVHGRLIAEEVIVRGRVIGPIRAVHVHIFAGAHVQGDVVNSTLSIENGAWVDGMIHRSDDPLGEVARDYEDLGGELGWASYEEPYAAEEEEAYVPPPEETFAAPPPEEIRPSSMMEEARPAPVVEEAPAAPVEVHHEEEHAPLDEKIVPTEAEVIEPEPEEPEPVTAEPETEGEAAELVPAEAPPRRPSRKARK